MKKISKKELVLASKMLELASDKFSNHVCNDVDENVYDGWTLEERQQLVKEFHEWNGDPEEYEETFLHLGDSAIMGFLSAKLEAQKQLLIGSIITSVEFKNAIKEAVKSGLYEDWVFDGENECVVESFDEDTSTNNVIKELNKHLL